MNKFKCNNDGLNQLKILLNEFENGTVREYVVFSVREQGHGTIVCGGLALAAAASLHLERFFHEKMALNEATDKRKQLEVLMKDLVTSGAVKVIPEPNLDSHNKVQ